MYLYISIMLASYPGYMAPPTHLAPVWCGQDMRLILHMYADEVTCITFNINVANRMRCYTFRGTYMYVAHIHTYVCRYTYMCIISTDNSITVGDNCTDGEIRLVNGTNPLEGRVEICFNRAWGTICSNGFGEAEAEVVCTQIDSQMSSTHNQSIPFRDAHFGEGVGPIFLDRLGCNGSETQLTGDAGCFLGSPVGIHACYHSQDAAVICTGTYVCKQPTVFSHEQLSFFPTVIKLLIFGKPIHYNVRCIYATYICIRFLQTMMNVLITMEDVSRYVRTSSLDINACVNLGLFRVRLTAPDA